MVNGDSFEGEFKLYGGEELKVGETLVSIYHSIVDSQN